MGLIFYDLTFDSPERNRTVSEFAKGRGKKYFLRLSFLLQARDGSEESGVG